MISIKDNCEVLVTYRGVLSASVEALVITLRSIMASLKVEQQYYSKPAITIKSKKTIKAINQLLLEDCTVLIEDRITNDFATTNAILLKAKFDMYNTLYEIHSTTSTVKLQKGMSIQRLAFVALSLQSRVDKLANKMLLKATAEATLLLLEGKDVAVYFKYSPYEPKPLTSLEDLDSLEAITGNLVSMYGYSRKMTNYDLLPHASYNNTISLTVEAIDAKCSYQYSRGSLGIVRHSTIIRKN